MSFDFAQDERGGVRTSPNPFVLSEVEALH